MGEFSCLDKWRTTLADGRIFSYSSEHKFVKSVTCLAETGVLQGGKGFLITRNYIIRASFSIADFAMLPNCVLFLQVMHCTPGYSRLVSTCGWPSWEHVTLS